MVAVWREAECFWTGRRAALAWCEALTRLPDSGAPDELFDELTRRFRSEQVVALTPAIVANQRPESLERRLPHSRRRRGESGPPGGGPKAVDESRIVIEAR